MRGIYHFEHLNIGLAHQDRSGNGQEMVRTWSGHGQMRGLSDQAMARQCQVIRPGQKFSIFATQVDFWSSRFLAEPESTWCDIPRSTPSRVESSRIHH